MQTWKLEHIFCFRCGMAKLTQEFSYKDEFRSSDEHVCACLVFRVGRHNFWTGAIQYRFLSPCMVQCMFCSKIKPTAHPRILCNPIRETPSQISVSQYLKGMVRWLEFQLQDSVGNHVRNHLLILPWEWFCNKPKHWTPSQGLWDVFVHLICKKELVYNLFWFDTSIGKAGRSVMWKITFLFMFLWRWFCNNILKFLTALAIY